jgi:hypothetical protein
VSQYNAIYGSFAALPLFLIWLQMSWLIVLFGAELSFAHQNVNEYELEPDRKKVSDSLRKVLSLSVLHLLRGDLQKTVESGEKAIRHFDQLSSLMKLARRGDKVEFFRGMGVAAAATSQAYRNLGNQTKEKAYTKMGKDAFQKATLAGAKKCAPCQYAQAEAYLALVDHYVKIRKTLHAGS